MTINYYGLYEVKITAKLFVGSVKNRRLKKYSLKDSFISATLELHFHHIVNATL